MLRRLIDTAKMKCRKSIIEEYDKDMEIHSKIHIGRSLEGTVFEIVVAILNIVLWGLAIYFRNDGVIVWITALYGTISSVITCWSVYDPTTLTIVDLPKDKREPIHFSLMVRYNRITAVWWALVAITVQLSHFDRTFLIVSIFLGGLELLVMAFFHLLLKYKY